jgi:TPR repeat protein
MKAKKLLIALAAAALMAPGLARAEDAMALAEAACDAHEWPDALAWFEKAADRGDVKAQTIAALMYLYGDRLYPGVERDVPRAVAWLRRAQAAGSAEAGFMLARLAEQPGLDPARLVATGSAGPAKR